MNQGLDDINPQLILVDGISDYLVKSWYFEWFFLNWARFVIQHGFRYSIKKTATSKAK